MKRETKLLKVPLSYHAAGKEYTWYVLVSGGNFGHSELITSSQPHPQCHPFNILEIHFVMLGTARIPSFSLKGHYLHWEGTNIYAQTFARGLLKSIQIQVIPFSATSLPWKYEEIVLIFWQSSAFWKCVKHIQIFHMPGEIIGKSVDQWENFLFLRHHTNMSGILLHMLKNKYINNLVY